MRFVAFLRGINVGGKNVIKMAALTQTFEAMGFTDVSTVIASGNVLFSGPRGTQESRIERALLRAFGFEAQVLLRSESHLRRIVENAPRGWPLAKVRCYVVFAKSPLTPATVLKVAPARPGIDDASAGPGAVYYGTRMGARTHSGLQRLLVVPEYKLVTIRDFKTCLRIRRSMEGRPA